MRGYRYNSGYAACFDRNEIGLTTLEPANADGAIMNPLASWQQSTTTAAASANSFMFDWSPSSLLFLTLCPRSLARFRFHCCTLDGGAEKKKKHSGGTECKQNRARGGQFFFFHKRHCHVTVFVYFFAAASLRDFAGTYAERGLTASLFPVLPSSRSKGRGDFRSYVARREPPAVRGLRVRRSQG